MENIVQIIIQAGSLGALLVLIYFLFAKIIPDSVVTFSKSLDKAVKQFSESLEKMHTSSISMLETQHNDFRESLKEQRESYGKRMADQERATSQLSLIMMYHDATVRGINPETVGDTSELLGLLRRRANGDEN